METYRIVVEVEEGGSVEVGWWVEHSLLLFGCEWEKMKYPRAKECLEHLSLSLESDGWFLLYEGDGKRESFCSDGVRVFMEKEESCEVIG